LTTANWGQPRNYNGGECANKVYSIEETAGIVGITAYRDERTKYIT
jgi:hypothetical protein